LKKINGTQRKKILQYVAEKYGKPEEFSSPLVNGLAILLGVIMLLAALYLHNYHYYNYYF
jgi:hypothetical protein